MPENKSNEPPRCGDHVLHRPSGETWLVAFADPKYDEIAPAGWPGSRAKLSDCEVVKRCSDAEHTKAVDEWFDLKGYDSRRGRVLAIYGDVYP